MRKIKLTILLLLLLIWISPVSALSMNLSTPLFFNKKLNSAGDTSEVNKYTRLAMKYGYKPVKLELMKANIDTAEMICQKQNLEIPALLHLARAEYFYHINDFNNSSQEANIAMKIAKSKRESVTLIKIMGFYGSYFRRTGYFKESVDYFKNGIEIAKEEHIKGYIPLFYTALADTYNAIGDLAEFKKTLKLLIEAAYKEHDTTFVEQGFYRLGTSLTGKERDFKKADSLLRICLEISLQRDDSAYISLSLANLGWNFYLEKRYDDAIRSYNRSLTYSLPMKRYGDAANAYGNLGTIYRDIGKTDLSLHYYLKSIDQAKRIEDIYNLTWVYQDMSDMYLSKRDTSNAYKTFVLFKKYSDSQIKTSNIQGLTDARLKYEADSRNKELELLSLRIKNQRLLIYGYTGLFILCLAIGILIYSRSKINNKRRMSEMNRKISEVTQANLRQQMNPHFIFNTLNSIQYYMYQHDKLATNNYLTKFSSLMRKVLENSQHTSVPLRDELDALNLYLELEKIRFKEKFDYQINIDEEIDTLLYKIPTMLIQPYVENSICHGVMPLDGNGLVKIDLKLEKEYITCIIEDNGIGREAAQEKKMKSEKNHNSLGTQIVTSRLDLVNALYGTSLKTIYTDLKNDNGDSKGTRVEIHIPILT
jgi:tetratricopeptide (TPR) repeat protein